MIRLYLSSFFGVRKQQYCWKATTNRFSLSTARICGPAREFSPSPLLKERGISAGGPAEEEPAKGDAIIANLFLHHFQGVRLAELLRGVARLARVFVALEPRRSRWALAASRQLWAIGCNQVTRHDAPVSVRAGFAGQELSRLWPENGEWQLEEQRAGWFSHLFVARRRT